MLRTELHTASEKGDLSRVKQLVNKGASVNVKDDDGKTPLYISAMWNRLDIVKYLLQNNTDPNLTDGYFSPLIKSVHNWLTNIMSCLVEHGADINQGDQDGRTPLWWAAFCGHTIKVTSYLLSRGPDVSKPDNKGRTPLYIACLV